MVVLSPQRQRLSPSIPQPKDGVDSTRLICPNAFMAKSPRSQPLVASEEPLWSRSRRPRDPSQPRLPLDPMPSRIEPCLALGKQRPPRGDEWTYEIKWDGYRLCVHLENGRVRILTRGGHDWTHRFPSIEQSAKRLGVGTAIIDGEAVVLDEQGRPDFGRLQQSLGGRLGKKSSDVAIMMAFDLLYFDGHDIRSLELSARRLGRIRNWAEIRKALRKTAKQIAISISTLQMASPSMTSWRRSVSRGKVNALVRVTWTTRSPLENMWATFEP